MTAVTRPHRYRIILRGECGPLMAGVLDDLLIESFQGWTCVMALVHDESELNGLLDRFQDFALHVVSLNELAADVRRPPAAGQRPTALSPGRAASAEWLKGAAVGDPAIFEAALDPAAGDVEQSELDVRAHAIARLAALVADGEPGTAYVEHVATALDHGVTLDEIVGVLVALLPTVGAPRVTAAAAATLGAISRIAADVPPVTGRNRPYGA
jgi:4-carboxymuconolactone decarboxylase